MEPELSVLCVRNLLASRGVGAAAESGPKICRSRKPGNNTSWSVAVVAQLTNQVHASKPGSWDWINFRDINEWKWGGSSAFRSTFQLNTANRPMGRFASLRRRATVFRATVVKGSILCDRTSAFPFLLQENANEIDGIFYFQCWMSRLLFQLQPNIVEYVAFLFHWK